jgi:putative addiction module component (TIGR02574 family)
MATHIEILEAEALQLSAAERALLVQVLIASLDADVAVEEAWAVEVERRHAQIESGEVQLIPGDVALAQVRAKYR